jgi:hypothetical protein
MYFQSASHNFLKNKIPAGYQPTGISKNQNAMVKLQINLKTSEGAIVDKDSFLKYILREAFDSHPQTPEGYIACDEIIEVVEHYGYYQLAIEMRKDIESELPYKVLQCYGKNEIEGDRLMDAAKLEEASNDR